MKKKNEKESWFWWHWQNLNEKALNQLGNAIKAGRAWFRFGKAMIHIEWGCKINGISLCINSGDYEGVGLGFHIHLIYPYIYFMFSHPIFNKIIENSKEFGIYINSEYIQLRLFSNDFEYNNNRCKFFNYRDFILGKMNYIKNDIKSFPISVPLPEGSYYGTATISERIWKRSRLPFNSIHIFDTWVDLNDGHGLPCPGKGENSWDCGENAITGYGCNSIKYADIVAKGTQLCIEKRLKYGGINWLPDKFNNGKIVTVNDYNT